MFRYYALLTLFCLLFFGYAMIGGRPLTMHEARLPMLTKQAMHTGEYLVPMIGDKPWVERPPLPLWFEAGVSSLVGGLHSEWQARLPNVIMGTFGVLLLALIAAKILRSWRAGVIAGFMQATTWEYYNYAWLAEDDIYLCVVIYAAWLAFASLEFNSAPAALATLESPPPP